MKFGEDESISLFMYKRTVSEEAYAVSAAKSVSDHLSGKIFMRKQVRVRFLRKEIDEKVAMSRDRSMCFRSEERCL